MKTKILSFATILLAACSVNLSPGISISASDKDKFCKDLCGDGICQEMVCMAQGCPCAETPATCPKDCKG